MHRLLTGYTQYYNRRYQRVGHLLQGRHKSILCQSDRYLSELVRYIHLNPVRAGMVSKPEDYPYSSHRAYLGLEAAGMVDVDPVLRHFGAKKQLARKHYQQFVNAGMSQGHREEFYAAEEGRILGTEEFIEATIHRIGDVKREAFGSRSDALADFRPELLLVAVEKICGMSRAQFCGRSKNPAAITAKEMFIVIGLEVRANRDLLSKITGISSSALSRRCDAARLKAKQSGEVRGLAADILKHYRNGGV